MSKATGSSELEAEAARNKEAHGWDLAEARRGPREDAGRVGCAREVITKTEACRRATPPPRGRTSGADEFALRLPTTGREADEAVSSESSEILHVEGEMEALRHAGTHASSRVLQGGESHAATWRSAHRAGPNKCDRKHLPDREPARQEEDRPKSRTRRDQGSKSPPKGDPKTKAPQGFLESKRRPDARLARRANVECFETHHGYTQ
jgi:hypothetical protein